MNILQKAMQFVQGRDKLSNAFDSTLSVKIAVGDRVQHRRTKLLGHCYQTGTVDGSSRVPALSVRYDVDTPDSVLVPAEEFTKASRYSR
jgi:hypothetical protein